MAELFDPLLRVTLLEQCERFSRELDASMSVEEGYPLLRLGETSVEIHLSKFHNDDYSYFSSSIAIGEERTILRFYFEDLLDYRNLKRALLSCFGRKTKTDPYSLPRFNLPRESYDKLMTENRVYLKPNLTLAKDYAESTYVFFVLCKDTVQFCRHWGLDKTLYRNCQVLPASTSQSGGAQ